MMPSPELMQQCAPNVAPQTLAAIIQVESGGNAFALGVNGSVGRRPRPKSFLETAALARYYISKGYSVDLGLMQINSNNLRGLGYSIEEVLDPCTNMKAGARILSRGYTGAMKRFGPGQNALRAALSAYNTGNYERGFQNGYVAKYYRRPAVRVLAKSNPPAFRSIKATAEPPVNPYASELLIYKFVEPPTVTTGID